MPRSSPLRAGIGALLLPLAVAIAADDPLAPAAEALAAGRGGRALERLEKLFAAGYPTPGDVYADPRFAALRETAELRGPWRHLMERHVRESSLTLVSGREPGEPMHIRGRVVGAADGAPVAGAVIYLYHTDDTGNYEPGAPVGAGANPRLFAWVRTDAAGRFQVRTVKPSAYPGSGAPSAHVHYVARADGFRRGIGTFHPYTHPEAAAARAAARERGRATSEVTRDGDRLLCDVVLSLRPRD